MLWDLDNDGDFDDASGSSASRSFSTPTTQTIRAQARDRAGNTAIGQLTVVVSNAPPVITGVTGPTDPVPVNTTVTLVASFTDAPTDTHTCSFAWDDGTSSPGTVSASNGSGTCTGSRTYSATGVYTVRVTVTDNHGGSATFAYEFVVVYDARRGFITGGGWIASPAGAYTADPGFAGRANFGFVARYRRGESTPSGETEFRAGALNFHSRAYQWLVVSDNKAQLRGTGRVNGVDGYQFLLTVLDTGRRSRDPDRFRIKIWNANGVVYDNVMGASDDMAQANPQPIAGGNIEVHD